jgi:hypothetical protein
MKKGLVIFGADFYKDILRGWMASIFCSSDSSSFFKDSFFSTDISLPGSLSNGRDGWLKEVKNIPNIEL